MAKQTLDQPSDLFRFQLRSSLKMEEHSLEALGELQKAARSSELQDMFAHHADETRQQIENLKQVFSLLETDATTAPSPSTTGIIKQARSLIDKTSPDLLDEVTLISALGTEHYEIASYEGLIVQARALQEPSAATRKKIVALLKENLDQEVHTSKELAAALKELL